ncbi:transposase [Saprospira grandis]|uniref:Transposase IS3/IS911 family protein n=1 Tax=Saprospira grandis (strain Lewin) TaxID=984262 RepID=H6L2Z3_SAPGL|nr:transposase [Saprospira grandis]AFC23720.1 transposase IS3/IS911 family protein [Saprospira grandis str. Lewin]
MRKSKFTEKQKLSILAEHDSGLSVADLCRKCSLPKKATISYRK